MDRQKNRKNNCQLTYYLDNTMMSQIPDGKIGFRVIARPKEGFAYYTPGEYRSGNIPVTELIKDNETLLLDIELTRHVDVNTFRIDPLENDRNSFKNEKPALKDVK